jgi:hypothetical protein
MSTLKTNNIEHLDASSPSIQLDVGGGIVVAGVITATSMDLTSSDGFTVGTGASVSSPATNVLTLGTDDAERVRIDSSGRLLVGVTTTDAAPLTVSGTVLSEGSRFRAVFGDGFVDADGRDTDGTNCSEVQIQSYQSNRPPVLSLGGGQGTGELLGKINFFNSNNTDGKRSRAQIICGQSGTDPDQGGALYFRTAADGGTSPASQMAITSDRFVRLLSGTGGIQFNGDTAAANALDDYEEGTWTPELTTSGTDFDSVSYQVRAGSYTKIGDLVFLRCNFYTSSVTKGSASGSVRVSGLPFASASLAAVCLHDVRLWDGNPSTGASISESLVYLFKRSSFNGNDGALQVSDVSTSFAANLCQFSGCYKIT